MLSSEKHLIISVHGIRTFGHWQNRLEQLVKEVDPTVYVYTYKYNYFSIIAFILPFVRWIVTKRFKHSLLSVCNEEEWDRIDIVGHSFGTHLIGWALKSLPENERPNVHTIILAGSVLKSTFQWQKLKPKIKRIVNECGTEDSYLILSQLAVLFTGMAGRIGFIGMENSRFRNRHFPIGHSGYFQNNGVNDDTFMKKYWLPLFLSNDSIEPYDFRKAPDISSGILNFTINNAEPIKLAIYLTPLILIIFKVYGMYEDSNYQRNLAISRELAAQSLNEIWLHPDSSLSKAKEAIKISHTSEAIQALNQVYDQINLVEVIEDPDKAPLSAASFSKDGNYLIISNYWGKIWLWDISKHKFLYSCKSDGLYKITGSSMNKMNTGILTGQTNKSEHNYSVCIYDTLSQIPHKYFCASTIGPITNAVYSNNGSYIATTGYDYTIAIWDVNECLNSNNPKPKARLQDPEKKHKDIVNSVRFSNDGESVLTASQDGRAKIWFWKTGKVVELRGFSQALFSAEFHPHNNKEVVTAGQDGLIQLWDVTTNNRPNIIGNHNLDVRQATFDSQGEQIVSASTDGTAKVWALGKNQIKLKYSLIGHRGAVTAANFSPNSRYIVTASVDGTARIWRAMAIPKIKSTDSILSIIQTISEEKNNRKYK